MNECKTGEFDKFVDRMKQDLTPAGERICETN